MAPNSAGCETRSLSAALMAARVSDFRLQRPRSCANGAFGEDKSRTAPGNKSIDRDDGLLCKSCDGDQEPVEASPQSLIFGGGGTFLAKYRKKAVVGTAVTKSYNDGDVWCAGHTTANDQPTRDRVADRPDVFFNSLLTGARSWERILRVTDDNVDNFNVTNHSTALHRLATTVPNSKKGALRRDFRFKRNLLGLSETLRTATAGSLKPQDLSNAAWALARLGILNNAIFGQLSKHIIPISDQFEPMNISMTLWAFARAGISDARLFEAMAEVVKAQLPRFEPQQIANTTWAMGKAGFVDKAIFDLAATVSVEKIDDFLPVNTSMLLFSFAQAQVSHPTLFQKMAKTCTAQRLLSSQGTPHVATNLALAYSKAAVFDPCVFDAVATAAEGCLHVFRCQQIISLASSFGTANVRHARLFGKISKTLAERGEEFVDDELEELLHVYDSLGICSQPIQDVLNPTVGATGISTWALTFAMFAMALALVLFKNFDIRSVV